MRKVPSPLASLVLFTLGCGALEVPDEPIYRDFTLKQMDFPLKSGLRVLVQEDHSSPLVEVVATYGVGDSSDPAGMEGLAHFVEHLQFRTRPGGSGEPVWEYLKRTGGAFNAFTAEEVTTYHTMAHKDQLETLLRVETWRLMGQLAGIKDEEFAVEREVVRSELRQRTETSPNNKLFELLFKQLFPAGHPYARTMIGTHDSLSASTLAAAREFVKKHYRPDNCTMVIAGDVDPKHVQELLGKMPADALFAQGKADAAPVQRQYIAQTPAPEVPPVASTAIHKEKGPVLQPQLLIGWSVPGGYRGKDALMEFAASSLNVALFDARRFTKENDDIESAGAMVMPMRHASAFVVFVDLRPGADPEKVRQRILDSISGAWDHETNQVMVTEGKWSYGVGLVNMAGDLEGSALALAEHLQATGRPAYFKERLEEVAHVPPGDVRDFAYQWLRRERAATVYVVPESDSAPALLAGGGKLKARQDGYLPGKDMQINLSAMGPEQIKKIAVPPQVAKLPRFKLSNGLEVFSVHRGSAPISNVVISIPGGDATVKPYGLAGVAKQFVYTRCPDHGRLQAVGGSYSENTGALSTQIVAGAFAGNLPNVLAVVGDELRCRELEEEPFMVLTPEITKLRKQRRERIQKDPGYLAAKKMAQTLYADHPYGVVEPDLDALAKLSQADVSGFIRTHYRPENAVAVIFGDFDEAQAQTQAEKFLGPWTAGGATPAVVPPPPAAPAERKLFLVNRPGATQSEISLGCRVTGPTADNVAAFDLTSEILSEQIWPLREALGVTYGMGAGLRAMPGPTADLVVQGAVDTGKTGVAVRTVLDLIEKFGTDGPDIKMFTLKRWDLAMSFATRFATADAIAGSILRARTMGWPLETWDRYPEQLIAASRASLRDLVAPCPGHEVVAIVGDAARVRPQLEAEGLSLQ